MCNSTLLLFENDGLPTVREPRNVQRVCETRGPTYDKFRMPDPSFHTPCANIAPRRPLCEKKTPSNLQKNGFEYNAKSVFFEKYTTELAQRKTPPKSSIVQHALRTPNLKIGSNLAGVKPCMLHHATFRGRLTVERRLRKIEA